MSWPSGSRIPHGWWTDGWGSMGMWERSPCFSTTIRAFVAYLDTLCTSGLAVMGMCKSGRHRDADLGMCRQLRRPAYGLRVNCGLVEMSTERFLELAKSQGIAAEISTYLPNEFIRVLSGLQVY